MGADFYFIGYLMELQAILTPLFSGSLEFCFIFYSFAFQSGGLFLCSYYYREFEVFVFRVVILNQIMAIERKKYK